MARFTKGRRLILARVRSSRSRQWRRWEPQRRNCEPISGERCGAVSLANKLVEIMMPFMPYVGVAVAMQRRHGLQGRVHGRETKNNCTGVIGLDGRLIPSVQGTLPEPAIFECLLDEFREFLRGAGQLIDPLGLQGVLDRRLLHGLAGGPASVSTISFEVSRGASKPIHVPTSMPGSPASSIVGTSGRMAVRFG